MLQAVPDSAPAPNKRSSSAPPVYLSNIDAQRRFGVCGETLKRWRAAGTGPRFSRFGSRIRYRLDDVLAFEAERTFESTADEGAARLRLVR